MNTSEVEHHGRPALRVEREPWALTLVLDPLRILGFRIEGRPSLFADLPDESIDGRYPLIGGHRLWAGPETDEVTYSAEIDPVEVDVATDEVTASAAVDAAGIGKTISVRFDDEGVDVAHGLTSTSDGELAPWAITQLEPGGLALLPLAEPASSLQAVDAVAVWPYTDLGFMDSEPGLLKVPGGTSRPFKVGVAQGRGWLAYRKGSDLFVKHSPRPPGDYVDQGAAYQVYSCPTFAELETLAPLSPSPVEHVERWEMHRIRVDASNQEILEMLGG